MPLIGAGDRDAVDQRSGMETVASLQAVGFNGEFTQCIREGGGKVGVGEGIGMGASIQHVVVVVALGTGHVDHDTGCIGLASDGAAGGYVSLWCLLSSR
jgi:hypothetical protein